MKLVSIVSLVSLVVTSSEKETLMVQCELLDVPKVLCYWYCVRGEGEI